MGIEKCPFKGGCPKLSDYNILIIKPMDNNKYTKYFTSCKGVFQGGGCKAISYIGAYKKAYERGVFFSELAGTSAGSIIAALIAAGAAPSYLEKLVKETNFKDFISNYDKSYLKYFFNLIIPKPYKKYSEYLSPKSIFQFYGIFKPDKIESFLETHLRNLTGLKSDVKFKDLIPNLHVVCADLKSHSIKVWNKEHTPNASVSKAVCASCCIPFFFQPIDNQYVDGGILSNLPNFLFSKEPHYNRILCFKLESQQPSYNIQSFKDFMSSLIDTIVEGSCRIQKEFNIEAYEVSIPINNISATDFNKLNNDIIGKLIQKGEEAMDNFLNDELTFSPLNKDHSILLQTKEQMRSLVAYISLEQQQEIYVSSKNTHWCWELFLSIVRWIKNESKITVFTSKSIDPKYEESENARRRMLKAMGCTLIETDITITGYFFKKKDSWKGILFQDEDENDFIAQYYNTPLDNRLIKEWVLKLKNLTENQSLLPDKKTSSTRFKKKKKAIISIQKISETKIIEKLKQEPIYQNAQLAFETIDLENVIFLNPYIRALKYKQIDCLFACYEQANIPYFSAAAFKFANNKESLIGPPVIEVHNNKYYIIEGNTRCVYAYKHGISKLKALIVKNVSEEIPCDTNKTYYISNILISDKKITAEKRYSKFNYDKFRHIEEYLRPNKEYMK